MSLSGLGPWIPQTPDGSSDTDLEQQWREPIKYIENENDEDE
jgi:hypothetical protein